MLLRPWRRRLRHAGIADERVRRYPQGTRGRDDAAAPVAKRVAVSRDGDARANQHMIGSNEVGNARVVHAKHENHGRGLWEPVEQLVAHSDLHLASLYESACEPIS